MTTVRQATLTLVATDLTRSPAHAVIWRTLKTATRTCHGSLPGLAPDGLATAAGYWFAETEQRLDAQPQCVLVLPELSELSSQNGTGTVADAAGTPGLNHRHFPKVSLPGPSVGRRARMPTEDLELVINGDRAYVGVDPSAWASVAEPVLLTVSLCWRLSSLVEQLDELAEWSREPASSHSRNALGVRLCSLRGLVLDLPHFEGPLVDPRGYFTSPRAARLFRALVKHLGLDTWRTLIDEHVEIVEATLGALAEEQRHREALLCANVLEVLILLALLADIAINLFLT